MDSLPETSESLILRVKDAADEAAWAEFLAIYRPVIFRLARKRGLQNADADDLAQKVFMSIARAIEGWSPGAERPPFRVWLFKIARNEIVKAITRRRPDCAAGSSSIHQRLQQHPEQEPEIGAELLKEGRLELFRWAAEEIRVEFTESTWSMFWQSSVEGLSAADVAVAHRRSTGAVYIARYRVMQRLKEKVGETSQCWNDE